MKIQLMMAIMVSGIALMNCIMVGFYLLAKMMDWIPAPFMEKANDFGSFSNNLMISVVSLGYISCIT